MNLTEEYFCGPAYGETPAAADRAWLGLRSLCAPCARRLSARRMYAVRLPREADPGPCERCSAAPGRPRPLTPERFLQARRCAAGLTDEDIARRARERMAGLADVLEADRRLAEMFEAMTWLPSAAHESS